MLIIIIKYLKILNYTLLYTYIFILENKVYINTVNYCTKYLQI